MVSSTTLIGKFKINKKLDKETEELINGLSKTRRMKRDTKKLAKILNITEEECIERYLSEGQLYIPSYMNDEDEYNDKSIIDFNKHPKDQPDLNCNWKTNGETIYWNRREKFHTYIEWIEYIIRVI